MAGAAITKDFLSSSEIPVIVGIGSSEGGIEAILDLIATLSINNECAYVIAKHLSPQEQRPIIDQIAQLTIIPAIEIQDKMPVIAGKIYIPPAGKDVALSQGRLNLTASGHETNTSESSFDHFLNTLAEECRGRCIAVILSGAGNDGAYGIQAVRETGGITIAQDSNSAKYDGMIAAAVETGCVDLVLRPDLIGAHLKKILSAPNNFGEAKEDTPLTSSILGILQIVLAHTRVDFRDYKQSTVRRRIERRMTTLGIETGGLYAEHCRSNPDEIDALFKDLLISVTRFFRDKNEFDDLAEPIKELVNKRQDDPLRIWIAGCATGEEVYSIAILLAEAIGGPVEHLKSKVQIFATDINKAALDLARKGEYSHNTMHDVPLNYTEKYFAESSGKMRVIEALRSTIIFSEHNLCQDPPYLNIDFICCRNVLIYFGLKPQSKVLSRLHYSLKTNGYLFLGTAETVTSTDQLFLQAAEKARIFRKRELHAHNSSLAKTSVEPWTIPPAIEHDLKPKISASRDRNMFDGLARALGENSVLVSADFTFQRVFGDISRYVDLSEQSGTDLNLSLLKSPLRLEAYTLVTLALKQDERQVGVKRSFGKEDERVVRLEAFPISTPDSENRYTLLVINSWPTDQIATLADTGAVLPGEPNSGAHFFELDQELTKTRKALQRTIEELEASNQELQSLSQELQSTNEELQATNAEIGTSNVQLQTTNEDLITANEEIQINASKTQTLNAELGSILDSIPLPLLVVNRALQIARATTAAADMFSFNPALPAPHLSQIILPDGFPALIDICKKSLETSEPVSVDFASHGTVFSLQCTPFSNTSGQCVGATIVLFNTRDTHNGSALA
jgi:two-component system CheB/CheR fusion protein